MKRDRKPSPETGRDGSGTKPVDRRRVLVVDDSVDSAEATRILLEFSGYDARVAHDGRGALAAAADFRPHAVLLDLGLPDIDGYEVLGRLRECSELAETRFVALSGREIDPDRDRADGRPLFDLYLLKPASVDQIRAAVQ